MSEALRQLIASFTIEVDRAGELARGNAAVDSLKKKLEGLQAAANPAARAVSDVFSRAGGNVNSFLASQGAKSLGGRADNSGFGAAGAAGATRAADAAATAYAGTLRGRLASAVASVRASVTGSGAAGGGGGLIGSLTSLRGGLIALGVGTAIRAVKHMVDGIGDISEAAARLDVTIEDFQRLRVLAEQNGTSVEALGTAFRTLANSAVQPTKETAAAFAALGVQVKNGDGTFRTTQDIFFDVAGSLAEVSDTTKRAALAQDVLGRSAMQLKPIFAEGRAGVDRQREALAKMVVLSAATVTAADHLSDSWKLLGPASLTASEPLLEQMIPALQWLTDTFLAGSRVMREFLTESKIFENIATVFTTLTLPIALVFRGLKYLVDLMGGKGTSTAAKFADVIGRIGVAFSSLLAFFPLLIDDFQTYLAGGDSLIGRAIDSLKGAFSGAWDAIRDSAGQALDFVLEKAKAVGRAVLEAVVPEALRKYLLPAAEGAGKVGGATGGIGAPATIPSYLGYGPPTAAGSTAGNTTIGDTILTFNGVRPGDGKAIAQDLERVLEQGRDAIIAAVPQ